jgi:hypothetical protein
MVQATQGKAYHQKKIEVKTPEEEKEQNDQP